MGKHAFDSRGQSANLFVQMAEGLDEGLLFLDRDLRITYANPAAATLLWTPEKGLRGKPLAEAIPDTLGRTILEKAVTSLNTGSAVTFEDLSFTPMLSCRILPVGDGLTVVLQDISVKKDAEELLRLSELKFQAAFQSSPDLMAISDPVSRAIIDVNASFLSCTGFSREEVIGKRSIELGLWTDPADQQQQFERFMAGEPVDGSELTLRRKDGELRDMLFWVRLLDVGRNKYLYTMGKDVTEEKRADRKLREDEEQLRALSDNLPSLAIYRIRFEPDGPPRIEYISAGIERLAGISPLQAMKDAGTVYRRIVHDDLMGVMAMEAHAYSTLSPFECEARMKHASTGEIRWVLLRSIPSMQEDGSIVWNGIILDISLQKQAEQALLKSEAKFRFLTEKMSDMVWTCDLDLKITYVSPSEQKILGYAAEERIGRYSREIMCPESYAHAMEALSSERERSRLEGADPDRTVTLELEYYHKNGSRVWLESVYSAICDETGKAVGIYSVSRDITEKKMAAERLSLSEQKFEAAFRSGFDAMAIAEIETGTIVEANDSLVSWSGYSRDELIGKTSVEMGFWEDHQDRDRVIEILQTGETTDGLEIKMRRRNGELRDVLCRAQFLDVGGRRYILTFTRDVTEEKAAAKKLRESEEMLRSMSDNLPQVAIYRLVLDPQMQPRFEFFSAGIGNLYGIKQGEVLGDARVLYNMVHPDDLEALQEAERISFLNLTPFEHELRIRHPATGEISWILLRSVPFRKEDGSTVCNGAAMDISSLKLTEQALRENEAKYRFLTEKMSDEVWTCGLDMKATYISPSVEKLLGYTPEERLGKDTIDIMPPGSYRAAMELFMGELERDGLEGVDPYRTVTLELEYYHKNGSLVWMENVYSAIRNESGEITGLHAVCRDITEKKRAAENLRESEAKFRFLTEKMSDVVWTCDLDLMATYVTPSVERLMGYTPEERLELDPRDIMTPESFTHATELLMFELERDGLEGVDPNRAVTLGLDYIHKNGSIVHTENIASAIRDATGNIIGVHAVSRDITERKQADEILRLTEKKLEAAFQSSPDPMMISDFETGLIMDVNSTFLQNAGFSRDEVVGKLVHDLNLWVDPGDRDRVNEQLMAGEPVNSFEVRMFNKHGRSREMLFSARLLDVGGRKHLFTLIHDITDERAAAKKLKESETLLRSVSDNLPQVATFRLVSDQGLHFEYISAGIERLTGITPEAAMKDIQALYAMILPGDLDRLRNAEKLAFRALAPFECEIGVTHASTGEIRWLLLHSIPLKKADGPVEWDGVIVDITERKRMEVELQESLERFQLLSEATFEGIILSQGGVITDANDQVISMMSYTRTELIGKKIESLVLPEDIPSMLPSIKAGIEQIVEHRMIRKDGSLITIEAHGKPWKAIGRGSRITAIRDITERKQAEQALRESEAKYRFLTERMSDVVWTTDRDLTVTYISPSLEKAVGYAPEEWTGLNLKDLVTPGSFAHTLNLYFEELERDGLEGVDPDRTIVHEMEFLHRSGSPVWVESLSSLIHDQSGMVVGAYGVTRDITESKKAESALRDSEARLSLALSSAELGIWDTDVKTGTSTFSDRFKELFGLHPSAHLTCSSFPELVHPDDREFVSGAIRGAINPNGAGGYDIQYRTGRQEGFEHWISSTGKAFFEDIDGKKTFVRFLGTVMDITGMKQAEKALRESGERLRHAQMAGKVGIFDWDLAAGKFVMIDSSRTILEEGEYHEDAPENWAGMIHPEDLPMIRDRLRQAIRVREQEITIEHRLRPAGDVPRWFSTRAFISYDEMGRETRIAGTTMDITALKQAREDLLRANEHLERKVSERTFLLQEMNRSLLEQKEVLEDVIRMRERMDMDIRRLATAVDHTQDSIMLISPDGIIEYANPATEKISGFARHELIGKSMADFGAYYQDENLPSHVSDVISQGKNWTGRSARKKSTGEEIVVDLSAAPVFDQSGNLINFVTVSRDVTSEVELRDQITQVQKMNAISAMAGGIAFDLRNTFMPILVNTRILLEHLREDNPAHHFAGEVLQETHSGLDLVDQLLTLSHSDIQEKRTVTLPDVVREAVSILRATLPSTIVIRHDLGAHEDTVLADPVQIKQVLIHLADNARQAMKGKQGLLSIRLDRRELGAREARRISPDLTPGTYARILVRDTGEGLDEGTKRMIFESFFLPLRNGKGKGMGLTVVLGIVTSHQGALTISSRQGKGSTFTVYLPVIQP